MEEETSPQIVELKDNDLDLDLDLGNRLVDPYLEL